MHPCRLPDVCLLCTLEAGCVLLHSLIFVRLCNVFVAFLSCFICSNLHFPLCSRTSVMLHTPLTDSQWLWLLFAISPFRRMLAFVAKRCSSASQPCSYLSMTSILEHWPITGAVFSCSQFVCPPLLKYDVAYFDMFHFGRFRYFTHYQMIALLHFWILHLRQKMNSSHFEAFIYVAIL